MATSVGDQVDGFSHALANNGFLDTTSALSGTQEAVVQVIWADAQIQVTTYDGTNVAIIWQSPGATTDPAWLSGQLLGRASLNTSMRIRIKNVSGGTCNVGWYGVLTHA